MPAYLVIQATVTKPEQFAEYAKRMPALIEKHGGRYRILGGDVEILEGNWDYRSLVISEWPSMQAARDFWNSDDYAAMKKLRAGALDATVLLAKGL